MTKKFIARTALSFLSIAFLTAMFLVCEPIVGWKYALAIVLAVPIIFLFVSFLMWVIDNA